LKTIDVVSVCNALVDILIKANEADLSKLNLTKGIMHLVDYDRQKKLLDHFGSVPRTVELGGSSMNAIRTLAALGKKAVFAGMVSKDEFGEKIESRLEQLGIDSHLVFGNEDATGSCVILITPDGERTMNTHLGSSRLYDHAAVPMQHIKDARVFHFSGYQWDTDGQKNAIMNAVKTASDHGTMVSFDLADPFVVNRHRDEFLPIIAEFADIVFTNKEESRMLYQSTPEKAAEEIAKTGAVAVVKLGSEGALIQKGNRQHRIAPVKTSVVDTTAAGDMFAAGFLYGYLGDLDLDTCGKMAATLASDVISRVGATVSNSALESVKNWSK
jgi:sugar/nucleoside kinase (ribokinase family)